MHHSNKNHRTAHTYTQQSGNEHLEGMMEGELFPDEVVHLFRNEARNLGMFKRKIEREKDKIALVVEQMKREVIHHFDDLKISLQAELDQLYRSYMDKYAKLRREVAAVTRLRDEAGLGLSMRGSLHHSEDSLSLNGPMIRSLNRTNMEVKQAHMLAYISEMQRDRANTLAAQSNELVVLSNYQEGYFQAVQFQKQGDEWVEEMKFSIRALLARKEEYIKELQIKEEPILKGVYQEQSPLNNTSYRGQHDYKSTLSSLPAVEQYPHPQSLCVDRGEVITLQTLPSLMSQSAEIVLCAIGVGADQLAVGSKDGLINIYQVSSGRRVAVLQGHKASICKLALVNRKGKTWLASGSDLGCSSIALWDTVTWTQQFHLFSHKAAVTSLADLLDGRSLISGSYDRGINIYDLDQQGQLVFTLTANKVAVSEIVVSCDGGRAVSCGLDDSLLVWQVVRGAGRTVQIMFLQRIIQNNTMICSLIASALNPALIFLGTKDGRVKMVSLQRGQAYKTIVCCAGAIIELAVVQRRTKPTLPMILCWPCGQQSLKIINSETGNATSIDTQGSMQFGCGLGPKGFFLPSRAPTLAVLSQNPRQRQVNLFQISVS